VACWLPRLSIGRRVFLIAASAIAAGIVVLIARTGSPLLRGCAPMGYMLAGYFLSGYLFASPSPSAEAWLMAWITACLAIRSRDSSAGPGRWSRRSSSFTWAASC
jgi:hypothetical protein